MPRVFKSMVGSRVRAARELVLLGIDSSTVLHADGTKVKTVNFDPALVRKAHQRHQLTDANCQLLRNAATSKVKVKRGAAAVYPPTQALPSAPTVLPTVNSAVESAADTQVVLPTASQQ